MSVICRRGVLASAALGCMDLIKARENLIHLTPDYIVTDIPSESKAFRVLSLDGGGAKGFYTLGALKEIEALVGCRLCEKFDLIYGTSTGAIIGALLGL